MHELRFSNFYKLSHIIYYFSPLTIIIALTIKAIGFLKIRQTFSNIFAMYYGDIKD